MKCRLRFVAAVWLALPVLWFVSATSALADQSLLKEKGLVKLNTTYVLSGEADFNKMFRSIAGLKKGLVTAQKALKLVENKLKANKALILQYTMQRRALRQRLAGTQSAMQYNQIIGAMNELADRITLLINGGKFAEQLKQARVQEAEARQKYAGHILSMRQQYDRLNELYQDLAADPMVKQAIATLNEQSSKKTNLGPTATFSRNLKQLAKLEETILSEDIPLLSGPGGLLYVTAVFNGQNTKQIAVDTGSSIVALPAKFAQQVGVRVTPNDPVIRLQLADGRTIDATKVNIDSLRVGPFIVKNVECAVFSAELTEAIPLLGQSFLRHFTYKIDADQGKLSMLKVEGR